MTFVEWLANQVEWLKSFLSDPQIATEKKKGSSKRVSAMVLILLFIYEYDKVVNVIVSRVKLLPEADFIMLYKLDKMVMPDIPEYWVLIIGSVLGIAIVDYVFKKRKTKEESIEALFDEHKRHTSLQTINLFKEIKKLKDEKNT